MGLSTPPAQKILLKMFITVFCQEDTNFLDLLFLTIVFGTKCIYEKNVLNEKAQKVILQYLALCKRPMCSYQNKFILYIE